MVKKKTNESSAIDRTQLIVSRKSFQGKLAYRIKLGEEILGMSMLTKDEFSVATQTYYSWDNYNSELLKGSFNPPFNEYKRKYDQLNSLMGLYIEDRNTSPVEKLKSQVGNKVTYLKNLSNSVELIPSSALESTLPDSENFESKSNADTTKVFIVHGHNTAVKAEVARMLDKLKLDPIILHEQANQGRTIIEKFEKYSDVNFAIVLLTDDDVGKAKNDSDLTARARQNVILELGYFIGKLSRKGVCALYVKGVELPNDLSGLVYVEIDAAGKWKYDVAKELREAGYPIDMNLI